MNLISVFLNYYSHLRILQLMIYTPDIKKKKEKKKQQVDKVSHMSRKPKATSCTICLLVI